MHVKANEAALPLPSFADLPAAPHRFFSRCMGLRSAVQSRTIDTSTHDIVEDFFVPMLKNAERYDRGVGYFTSGWLRATAQGMDDTEPISRRLHDC
jgi:hypothetical protein